MSCSLTNPHFHHPSFILVTSDCCQWGAEVSVHDAWSPYCLRGAWNGGCQWWWCWWWWWWRRRWWWRLVFPLSPRRMEWRLGLGDIMTWFQLNIIFHWRLSVDIVITGAWWWWRLMKMMWFLTSGNAGRYYGVERPDWGPEEISHPGFLPHRCQPGGDVPNIIQFYQIKLFSHGCQFSTRCGHRAMCCLI